ncbi:MAG: response regulator [Deltaproteobacteria bacterium]|nr:response regulator [Deltaproteobacteria bacterium]
MLQPLGWSGGELVSFDILVVEDSAAMRSFISSTVEEIEGVSTVGVSSGFEALKELPRRSFCLIITDINMPDINGLELIRFIRENERYQSTPLIIISTESSQKDRERGLALGANAYLVKPFTPEALKECVERYLETG